MRGNTVRRWAWFGVVLAGLASAGIGQTDVRLPKVFSAHGVLQRDRPIHVWGWATPGGCVAVGFHGQQRGGCADRLGEWSVYLLPEQAGGPYTLTVGEVAKGSVDADGRVTRTQWIGAQQTVEDLLVGDVWFASGQSNMEMPLQGFNATTRVKDDTKEIAAATHPRIRLLTMPKRGTAYPTDDVSAGWTECTPETARKFSAVAYFFGREIEAKEGVPIGLINSSWGGTPIAPWISLEAIGRDAGLMPVIENRARFATRFAQRSAELAAEARETAEAAKAGQAAPKFPWTSGSEESWNPGELFNGMIAPFTPYAVRGFLWYQGESDSDPERAGLYAREMRALIADWRAQWREGDLPFLYVQISSFSSPMEDWGRLRDEQRRALDVRATAMAVTLDVGKADNVHPPDKQTVGHRLALGARAESYGEAVEWRGPTPEAWYREGRAARIWFGQAQGLRAQGPEVKGFELAGADGVFHPATARIEGASVQVAAPEVASPAMVRYGWASATDADLRNADGLPASTFEETLSVP